MQNFVLYFLGLSEFSQFDQAGNRLYKF